MIFNLKRSKITGMRREEQQGMASIVVVSVLIVILTLISIGFARMMNRSAIDSANKQFSASATYAAESGINDVAAYLKQYAQANPGLSYLPKSTNCTGPNTLIGDDAHPGIFYNDSNLSGEKNSSGQPASLSDRTTKYTCILLNPTPNSLAYGPVFNLKSQVVKVNTSASAGALEKLMISWRPSNKDVTGYPSSSSSLSDETTWNSPTAACKDSSSTNADCLPLLRATIYPVTNGETLTSAQATSKTIFLYPQSPAGNVPIKSFTDPSLKDGSIVPVPCTQSVGANDFNPSTSAPYVCNIIISSLSSALSPASTDSLYLRLTPIYNQADIEVQANDKYGNNLTFINDQAVIDVTAQTAGVAKRLQARVDTSSLVNGATGTDTNISSGSDAEPEQALRTAVSLCKREIQTTTSIGFSSYVNFDDADGICHDLNGTTTTTNPVPTLTLTITGLNGSDNGHPAVDSEANNPDSPQNPVQKGTVFVGTSPGSNDGAARISWATTDATSCIATNGSSTWPGSKSLTITGNPPINGAGSQDIGSIGTVTSYNLQCSRPYAPSATPVKTVTIWPYPLVWFSQTSLTAGGTYSVSWNVENSTSCTASGSWSGSKSASTSLQNFSEGQGTWQWYDTSTKTYTITCSDPIGRTSTASITLGPNQSNNCGGGSNCNGNVSPPTCSAPTAYITDNGNGTGSWFFQGSCPDVSPYNGGYHINTSGNFANLSTGDVPASQAVPGYMGTISSPGTYCIQLIEWVPGWTSASSPSGDTGYNCKNIYPPLSLDLGSSSGIWDQGPNECSGLTGVNAPYNGTWRCRNGTFNLSGPGCADGVHRFTTCDMWWNVTGGSGSHSCTLKPTDGYYGTLHSGGENYWTTGTTGWSNGGNPYTWLLSCTDNGSGYSTSITKNVP